MKNHNIYMVERSMVGIGGHEATQHHVISQLSGAHSVIAITTTDFHSSDTQSTKNVAPILVSRKSSKNSINQSGAIENDARILQQFLEGVEPGAHDYIIYPSALEYEIRLTLLFYENSSTTIRTKLRMIRGDTMDDITEPELEKMRELVRLGLLSVHAESAETAQFLKQFCKLPTSTDIILPCTVMPDQDYSQFSAPENKIGRDFRIGYLGGLRREKGKMLIPHIIAELRRELHRKRPETNVQFIMQGHRHRKKFLNNWNYDFQMLKTLLPTMHLAKLVKVEKVDGYMSQEQFLEIMQSVDLLIVPYDAKRYQYRGSGVVVDGVLALKPIVYSEGMGAKEFLNFGNAESAQNAKSFARKTVQIIDNIADYKAATVRARDHLMKRIDEASQALAN